VWIITYLMIKLVWNLEDLTSYWWLDPDELYIENPKLDFIEANLLRL